jgi:hypothetical protein
MVYMATTAVELTNEEAVAIANALFMCLRPNNVRPPFDTVANIDAMESGYRKIAGSVTDLSGRTCTRCGRAWDETAGPWDSLGDPETGETELNCPECATPEERAVLEEHHERFVRYARQLYSTPAWKGPPTHA